MNQTDTTQTNINIARWLLRIGLAFVYSYAAIEIKFNPGNFLKYTPGIIETIMPIHWFLVAFSLFEILLSIWLISGKHTKYPALISFLLMAGIIIPNMTYFAVLFRNVAIALASLALFFLDSNRQK